MLGVRHAIIREALLAGKHVLIERPPSPTVSELDDLVGLAQQPGCVLFQTGHSQHNAAADGAKRLLAEEGAASLRIDWRESGQEWVWRPGSFGMCDPEINALSIFSKAMPFPHFMDSAQLEVPANWQAPVGVQIGSKSTEAHAPAVSANFNWLEEEGEVRTYAVETGCEM